MKCISIILLLAAILCFITPPSYIQVQEVEAAAVIKTLDVCHNADGCVPTGSGMLWLHECRFSNPESTFGETLDIFSYNKNNFLLSFGKKRPPRV